MFYLTMIDERFVVMLNDDIIDVDDDAAALAAVYGQMAFIG